MTTWTNIPKPTDGSGTHTVSPGMPIGLLLALTYSTSSTTPATSIWTNITKASGTSWTNIPKAT